MTRWRRSVRSAARRPSLGEAHAAIALVRDEPLIGEAAHHPAHRRRRDAERGGDLVGRRRLAAALELVDRLEVVLDRAAERRRRGLGAHAGCTPARRSPRTMQHRARVTVPHLVRHAAADQVLHALWPCVHIAIRSHSSRSRRRGDLLRRDRRRRARTPPRCPPPRARRARASMYSRSSLHLLALAQGELLLVARRPAVGDVDEHDRRRAAARASSAHVLEDRVVVVGVLERNEDAFVHGGAAGCSVDGPQASHPRTVWTSSHTFSAAITRRDQRRPAASARSGSRTRPSSRCSDVNITSGKTANESCRLRMTWLRMSSFAVPRLAADDGHDDRRHNGDEPRDEPAQPRPEPDVEEALHHDLAGERAGERRVLPGREQREREHRARARAEQRREQLVRVLDLGDLGVAAWCGSVAAATMRIAALMKSAKRQRDRRVDEGEAHRLALARRRSPRSAASARSTSAGRDCAASPSRRGCRSRCRASRGSRDDLARRDEAAASRAPTSGRARTISKTKQTPIVAMSAMTSASSTRTPLFCR